MQPEGLHKDIQIKIQGTRDRPVFLQKSPKLVLLIHGVRIVILDKTRNSLPETRMSSDIGVVARRSGNYSYACNQR